MKDIALQVAAAGSQKLNVLREYIQNEILSILQTGVLADHMYLVGGTALRFLYGTRRFSEDLDFSAGKTWRKRSLAAVAARLNWDDVVRDVLPFLEDPRETALLTRDGFSILYGE